MLFLLVAAMRDGAVESTRPRVRNQAVGVRSNEQRGFSERLVMEFFFHVGSPG